LEETVSFKLSGIKRLAPTGQQSGWVPDAAWSFWSGKLLNPEIETRIVQPIRVV
jgi:hypothetical protein